MTTVTTFVTAFVACILLISTAESRLSMKEVSGYTEETWKNMFDNFVAKHRRNYENVEEYDRRFQIYKVIQYK